MLSALLSVILLMLTTMIVFVSALIIYYFIFPIIHKILDAMYDEIDRRDDEH